MTVTDGRLTVSNAAGSSNNKINYIEITATDGSEPPDPTIPPPSATPTPLPGLVTNVVAMSGESYAVETLQEGIRPYIDRSYSVTSMPTGFAGQPFIRTANDDKWATEPDFLRFELTAAATVYVAYDSRVQALPAWLAEGGWTETGDLLGTSDVDRRLYRKNFPAGPVVLGGNAMAPMLGAESNYNVVMIAEDAPVSETATATNTPVATATATNTPVATATMTATNTPVATATATATNTPVATATMTATNTPVATATMTATNTPVATATMTATNTPVATATMTATNTPVATATATATNTPVATATMTATNTPVATATATNTPVATATATNTPVATATATNTPVATATVTATNTPVATATATNTPVATATATATNTPVATATATATNTPVATATATGTPVATATMTATNTPVATATATNTPVATATATNTPVATATMTATNTPVATATMTATATPVPTSTPEPGALDQNGTQWAFLEWSLDNPSYTGNPFDLVATATFVHQISGETRTTEMFYDGGDTWKFRFTGTQAGTWTVTTSSDDADLDGHRGTIQISASDLPGFVVAQNGQWVRSGTGQAFVPRYVIQAVPDRLSSSEIDRDIQTFIQDAGFNGFHVSMGCSWFDINTKQCDRAENTDPDPATFQVIEELITRTYDAGGTVHLWMWGDSSRDQNPTQGMDGLDGTAARRVQRYIAARLGPLPGWTMGYGYDVWEWADSSQIATWHAHMQAHLGWEHLLGARYEAEEIGIWTDVLEYASYEQVKPTYDELRQAFDHRPAKPTFSEDRWRNLDRGRRDFSEDELRRVAWNAMMAGGVAGIYGNLTDGQGSDDGSKAFTNAGQFRTLARFWEGRYTLGVVPCNELTDAVCLQSGDTYIFYAEDTTAIQLDLSEIAGVQRAIAVDTTQAYAEIDLGTIDATDQIWTAPYRSDWAIVIEP